MKGGIQFKMKIGIPRAITYYWFYPFWKLYFETLNIETIVSPPTNKEILDAGLRLAVDETCLPVKIFLGHVAHLINEADFVFVPSIKSTEPKRYYCPQIIALPETTRITFAKQVFLAPEINSYDQELNWKENYYDFALKLGYNHFKAREAVEKASVIHDRMQFIDMGQYYETKSDSEKVFPHNGTLKIALLGHPYLINDSFINFDLKKKLLDYGAIIKTPQELSQDQVNAHTTILKKDLFWSYSRSMVAASLYHSEKEVVDGFIFLSSFGCGTNAVIEPYILKGAEKLPLITITLDEHTSPTGIQTRLEAFLDMVIRHKEVQNEDCFPPNGTLAYRSRSLF